MIGSEIRTRDKNFAAMRINKVAIKHGFKHVDLYIYLFCLSHVQYPITSKKLCRINICLKKSC